MSKSGKIKKRFLLIFEDEEPDSETPVIIRLRAFLKRALRSYGLRNRHCEEVIPEPGKETKDDA